MGSLYSLPSQLSAAHACSPSAPGGPLGRTLLVEAVLGTVAGKPPPVVPQAVVPHQPAQDEEELVEADLVVLVLISSPEQL